MSQAIPADCPRNMHKTTLFLIKVNVNTFMNRPGHANFIMFKEPQVFWTFLPKSERSSQEPSAQDMLCDFKCSNRYFPLWKLRSHWQNKRGVDQNKSPQFFKQQHEYLCKQQNFLHSSVVNDSASKKPLLLSSFHIARMLIKQKETFYEAESVIDPCLKVVANLLHSGKHAVDELEQIPLSYNQHSMKHCSGLPI